MDDLYRHLDDLVSQKTVLYGQFIDLMGEEWKQITAYSLEKLEPILERKENLLIRIQEINIVREKVVVSIAEAHGWSPEEITLKEIIGMPDNPYAKRLAHHRRKLREQINTINRMNVQNRNLVKQSSRSVQDSVRYLYQPEPSYTPYHADGQLVEAPLESRMVSTNA